MKVAIDSGSTSSGHLVRGVGVYTRELIKALEKEREEYKSLIIEAFDFKNKDLSEYDLVHYPYFNPLFITLPLKRPTKVVVTIHDLIPLIYPKQYAPGLKGKLRFNIQKYLVNHIDGVITVSGTSKKDIVRFLGVNEEKISVVYEAPRRIFTKLASGDKKLTEVKDKYKLPDKFILYVGDVNYNKNIPTLVDAATQIKIPLVICGKNAMDIEDLGSGIETIKGPMDWVRFLLEQPHPELAHYSTLKEKIEKSDFVLRTGYVPDEDLVAIYNLAGVYCQPSFYEGFGLPVVEAMVCETPVVIARNNALVEVAGKAALAADPNSADDMAEKISELLKDSGLRLQKVRSGKKLAGELTWRKTAKGTFNVYKDILGKKK
jgi:glycosyltransferase involved in cell wall biosynthesis